MISIYIAKFSNLRADNIFKQLDERQLTQDEELVIQQRVELQRKMFQEYQQREEARKIQEVVTVIPELDPMTARRLLELCSWREEEATLKFTSDIIFRKVVLSKPAAPTALTSAAAGKQCTGSRRSGPRPRKIDPSLLESGGVFVGKFKSKLGPYQDGSCKEAGAAGEQMSCDNAGADNVPGALPLYEALMPARRCSGRNRLPSSKRRCTRSATPPSDDMAEDLYMAVPVVGAAEPSQGSEGRGAQLIVKGRACSKNRQQKSNTGNTGIEREVVLDSVEEQLLESSDDSAADESYEEADNHQETEADGFEWGLGTEDLIRPSSLAWTQQPTLPLPALAMTGVMSQEDTLGVMRLTSSSAVALQLHSGADMCSSTVPPLPQLHSGADMCSSTVPPPPQLHSGADMCSSTVPPLPQLHSGADMYSSTVPPLPQLHSGADMCSSTVPPLPQLHSGADMCSSTVPPLPQLHSSADMCSSTVPPLPSQLGQPSVPVAMLRRRQDTCSSPSLLVEVNQDVSADPLTQSGRDSGYSSQVSSTQCSEALLQVQLPDHQLLGTGPHNARSYLPSSASDRTALNQVTVEEPESPSVAQNQGSCSAAVTSFVGGAAGCTPHLHPDGKQASLLMQGPLAGICDSGSQELPSASSEYGVYILVKEMSGGAPVPVVGSELKKVRKLVERKLQLSSMSPEEKARHNTPDSPNHSDTRRGLRLQGQAAADQEQRAARLAARALAKMVSIHAQIEHLSRLPPDLVPPTLAALQLQDDDLAMQLMLAWTQRQPNEDLVIPASQEAGSAATAADADNVEEVAPADPASDSREVVPADPSDSREVVPADPSNSREVASADPSDSRKVISTHKQGLNQESGGYGSRTAKDAHRGDNEVPHFALTAPETSSDKPAASSSILAAERTSLCCADNAAEMATTSSVHSHSHSRSHSPLPAIQHEIWTLVPDISLETVGAGAAGHIKVTDKVNPKPSACEAQEVASVNHLTSATSLQHDSSVNTSAPAAGPAPPLTALNDMSHSPSAPCAHHHHHHLVEDTRREIFEVIVSGISIDNPICGTSAAVAALVPSLQDQAQHYDLAVKAAMEQLVQLTGNHVAAVIHQSVNPSAQDLIPAPSKEASSTVQGQATYEHEGGSATEGAREEMSEAETLTAESEGEDEDGKDAGCLGLQVNAEAARAWATAGMSAGPASYISEEEAALGGALGCMFPTLLHGAPGRTAFGRNFETMCSSGLSSAAAAAAAFPTGGLHSGEIPAGYPQDCCPDVLMMGLLESMQLEQCWGPFSNVHHIENLNHSHIENLNPSHIENLNPSQIHHTPDDERLVMKSGMTHHQRVPPRHVSAAGSAAHTGSAHQAPSHDDASGSSDCSELAEQGSSEEEYRKPQKGRRGKRGKACGLNQQQQRARRAAVCPAELLIGGSTDAISARGHTKRGRVKQKGTKKAELLHIGTAVFDKSWGNAGYIFTCGFKSRLLFRSSVNLDALCVHECEVLGEGSRYWPAPTFSVKALDRPEEPIIAKSCTGCWSGILRRINDEIEARRREGQDLPPPPKTAIAGPEYFGLNQLEVVEAIEALDPEHKHEQYWTGKAQRELVLQGGYVDPRVPGGSRHTRGAGSGAGGRGRGRRRTADSDEEQMKGSRATLSAAHRGAHLQPHPGITAAAAAAAVMQHGVAAGMEGVNEDDQDGYAGNRWSAIGRAQRYRQRCVDAGEDVNDASNPLPGHIDPVTLEPVVNPAISPFGHVMGLATWKAVLQDGQRCPFTKHPVTVEQLTVLTLHNIERYRDRIQ
ncbi:hypothetical protein CEUSTIGMA_g6073.t1 [Chlamydomonas eustigma]|uniref:Uncharacterized protein n=1 Tax=Chlamydomonas eustigma TaxID=1157962 RepID=A0A250X6E0_9CHLO|nr:hypothetical protein CEUSTIGMA_g6073.t1 [Chlamydomonas eustigma]|eukprot:GAX78635.1 hypothetical protein CEUSTIGMA_g6073.t1 [Chlamydomonas eustigma]